MPRTRDLKPGFFKSDELAALPLHTRLFFQGLWCWADRNGVLEDRPLKLKGEIMPYDNVSGDEMLAELAAAGMIERFQADGQGYIWIVKFAKHQRPHPKEEATFPTPPNLPSCQPSGQNHGRGAMHKAKAAAEASCMSHGEGVSRALPSSPSFPSLPSSPTGEGEPAPMHDPRLFSPDEQPFAEVATAIAWTWRPSDCKSPVELAPRIAGMCVVHGGLEAAERLRAELAKKRNRHEPTWAVWKRLGWEGGKSAKPPAPDLNAEAARIQAVLEAGDREKAARSRSRSPPAEADGPQLLRIVG